MAGSVTSPNTVNYNANINVAGDAYNPQGDKQVSEVHGRFYTAARGGNMYSTYTAAAVTLPVVASTLASKWVLVNPVGSGKNMELLWCDAFVNSATQVVGVVCITKPVTVAAAGLGTLTQGTIASTVLNAGTTVATTNNGSVATYYTAATHTDTPVVYKGLFNIEATAIGLFSNRYFFDGGFILPPGTVIDLVTTAAQANFWADMVWAEWPV